MNVNASHKPRVMGCVRFVVDMTPQELASVIQWLNGRGTANEAAVQALYEALIEAQKDLQ